MTVREGWPTFGQWQQNLELRRRTKSLRTAVVELTVDFSQFGIAMDEASRSMKNLARVWTAAAFNPKLGRWHWLGFHNKCSPIVCKKAAKLCNKAESDLRMEEYLDNKAYIPLFNDDPDWGAAPYRHPSQGQEFWDG